MAYHKFSILFIITCSVQFVLGSYLSYPRIHFAGQFRADSDTRNNDRCNYRMNKELNDDLNGVDWGFNGTNEFQFYDVTATLAVYSDGNTSDSDDIVGRSIVGNLNRPFAKLTDLDTDIQDHSTIYGLNFGIAWGSDENSQDLAFYGKWTRNVIAQQMWPRLKCYNGDNYGEELFQDSFPLGGQSTTRITDIDWKDVGDSKALRELKEAANGGDLMVRISIFYYTRNYPSYVAYNATLGYVVGVIGVPGPRDTLNVAGQRAMTFSNFPTGLMFDDGDLCDGFEDDIAQFGPWMYTAPFEVDQGNSVVHLDISNSIPTDLGNSLRNIGVLRIGVLRESCVQILGEEDIPYDDNKALPITSGIYDIPVDASLFADLAGNSLVMGQYLNGTDEGTTPICGEFLSVEDAHSMNILLQESEYFIRPNDYYVDRLDRVENPSSTMDLYVTRYGEPAVVRVRVQVGGNFIPADGMLPSSSSAMTNEDGIASFQFSLQDGVPIPAMRQYGTPQCNGTTDPSDELELPIEGQAYNFTFCVDLGEDSCQTTDVSLAFLAFSDVEYNNEPTWVDDVEPVLAQFARLSAIMNTILDMSSYREVTKSHNIDLMRKTLMLDFEDPSYMPTTRDLSPAKRAMILKWLDNPKYDSSGKVPLESRNCVVPHYSAESRAVPDAEPILDRCDGQVLKFKNHPEVRDSFFAHIYSPPVMKGARVAPLDRPLLGWALRNRHGSSKNVLPITECTIDTLQMQLQTAIQLEWATLPTYLTTMYSIVDGCNTQIYELIRGVIMQEMLHFTQVANILIAVSGAPLIDDASVTASYPTHLPGAVLPNLTVTLRKMSLAHVHDVFMAIELPQHTEVGGDIDNELYTIGAFYDEVSDCIEVLGDDIFDPESVSRQVQWPWNAGEDVGIVYNVTDALTARNAIDAIVSQGEGANPLDPTDIENNTLAHFFQFEEIVCQNHLKKVSEDTYSYTGEPIPFNEEGVWPMRPDPKASDILNNTNCYTESKVFHQAYRNLLRKLQTVFNGSPEEIFNAVSIMESLQVHAKRLMWTKFNPSDPLDRTTCGPVWDYEWPEN